jgi:hypothetical protein
MAESTPVPTELIQNLKLRTNGEKSGEPGKGQDSKTNNGKPRRETATVKEKRITNLTIEAGVFGRLEIEADMRGVTLSELANNILDRGPDHFEVKITKIEKPKTPELGKAAGQD